MGLLCDFHTHTQYSDGKLSLPELVDFYGRRGFDVLGVTDHLCEQNSLLGRAAIYLDRTLKPESFRQYMTHLEAEAERAWQQYRMILLPGFEITKNSLKNHRSCHFLALGLDRYVSPDHSVIEAAKAIREAGGLCIAAHPISNRKTQLGGLYLWDNREDLAGYFDAWEITDNQRILPEVAQSKFPKLANTDFHRPSQIESWKTVLHCEKHPEAVLDAIRKQSLSFHLYREKASELKVA
ncbi:MAG: phosphotransferase [Bradymonadales bacterium]|nr:MAG: phosphotransferase [Bradymonadales bacterium]